MTWRTGKHGHHTGRTVRSPFARSSTRREGIFVKKVRQTTETSEESQTVSLIETTNYSLGKQKRWLMPEIIRDSANPREVVGEEDDFLLVEQRMDDRGIQNGRRGRCISVYDSSTKRTRKPRRRYGQVESLKSDSSQTDLEFEVHYPSGKGTWPRNSEVKYGQKCGGKRKGSSKNRRGKWNESQWSAMVDEEDASFIEENDAIYDDAKTFDDDDDDDDKFLDASRAALPCTSLGEYVINSKAKQARCIQSDSTVRSSCSQEKISSKKNVIIVDDKELVTEHERFVSRARKMDSLILSYLNLGKNQQEHAKKARKRRRRALRESVAQLDQECEEESMNESSNENENIKKESYHLTPEVYPSCKISLQGAEVLPSELRQSWGESYREAGCVPRKFSIDLSEHLKSSSEIVDLAVMTVLFELEQQEVNTSDLRKASVKLIIHNGLAGLDMPLSTAELIKSEFLDLVQENGLSIPTVKDIVDAGIKCIGKYDMLQKEKPARATCNDKKPFYTSEVFAEVLGWKGRSCTEEEAFCQAKKEMEREQWKEDPEKFSVSSLPETECEICFEGGQNCTTLISCGHSFCNSCWEVYIKCMLNVGETNLQCPGHQCQTTLDDITIMGLATSWYGRYFSWKIKRNLAKKPTLKHCPSEGCQLVMQIVPSNKGAQNILSDPLPVVCACKQFWCFKCQEPAHWPSQCEQAQEFRNEYKEYARKRMRDRSRKKEITSVMVKKCPNCSYPIEKFQGCDHMYCILCGVDFCWLCLQSHKYMPCTRDNRKINPSEILLPKVPKNRTQTLTDIALSNRYARKSSNIIAVQKKLKSMEQGINAYCYLKTKALKNTKFSRTTLILEGMIKHNTLHKIRDAFNFKSQAHVALEGLAIVLIKSAKVGNDSLQNDLTRLLFIMEGLDDLLKSPCSLCNKEVVTRLIRLIERGKMCIRDIKRHVKTD